VGDLGEDLELRNLLLQLSPAAGDTLRRVLIHDQPDRDAIASDLLRYRDQTGDDWADIIDMLTLHPEARRRVVRLLSEIDTRWWRSRNAGPSPWTVPSRLNQLTSFDPFICVPSHAPRRRDERLGVFP
jgi:hypothetical protein